MRIKEVVFAMDVAPRRPNWQYGEDELPANPSDDLLLSVIQIPDGDNLLQCLERQLQLVADLTRIAEEKSRVIGERQRERFVQLLHEEADAVHALAREEERRLQLGARLGLHEGATIEEWLQKVPGDVRLPLQQRAHQLRKAVRRLQSLVAANDALVQQELAYIRFAIDVLAGPAPEDLTYGPTGSGRGGEGRPAVPVNRSLFDFKA